jgi:predicted RNA polymerase sigma factor
MSDPKDRDLRIRTVLHVLYLIFNEGYTTTSGLAVHRADLTDEAIRLTRLLKRAVPDDSEIDGLLALMLLIDARRPARTSASGDLVPLPQQDRRLWRQALIDEGIALLDLAMSRGVVGEYQLQGAIAAVHDRAPQAEDTDWPRILFLYELLDQMTGNPMVTLNRAVAAAMVHGPSAGLAVVDEVADSLGGQHRVDAVRAHLLEMAGDNDGAVAHYEAGARRTTSLPEQRYLAKQAARLRHQPADPTGTGVGSP